MQIKRCFKNGFLTRVRYIPLFICLSLLLTLAESALASTLNQLASVTCRVTPEKNSENGPHFGDSLATLTAHCQIFHLPRARILDTFSGIHQDFDHKGYTAATCAGRHPICVGCCHVRKPSMYRLMAGRREICGLP
jgi:hypothetical protein